jgi:predicted RND superfamily exporter protein
MERFEERFGKWVVERRWWLIIATILVVLTAASGVRFLTINRDNRVFFSEENPQLQALEALENTYSFSPSPRKIRMYSPAKHWRQWRS